MEGSGFDLIVVDSRHKLFGDEESLKISGQIDLAEISARDVPDLSAIHDRYISPFCTFQQRIVFVGHHFACKLRVL
jgi:hypothetical protein